MIVTQLVPVIRCHHTSSDDLDPVLIDRQLTVAHPVTVALRHVYLDVTVRDEPMQSRCQTYVLHGLEK